MVVSMIFAQVWGVTQVIILGSMARTVRVKTALMAMAVGLYVCASASIAIQLLWTRSAAWLLSTPMSTVVDTASYTLDPLIEEIIKLLPLAGLLMIPVIRRQWSLTDCVIIGAATGSGFGLAEGLLWNSSHASSAISLQSGWLVKGSVVPGPLSALFSLFPVASSFGSGYSSAAHLNCHLVWSALGGLAVGLIMLNRTAAGKRVGIALLVFIAADHAAGNYAVYGSDAALGKIVFGLFNLLWSLLWLCPMAALFFAWRIDRNRQHTGDSSELILAAEQAESSRSKGILKAAISLLPDSLLWVSKFVRMRRVYNTERLAGFDEAESMLPILENLRDRIDHIGVRQEPVQTILSGWIRESTRTVLRKPIVIAWAVLLVPAIIYLVLGGQPQTAGFQEFLTAPVIWRCALGIFAVGQVWLLGQVLASIGSWRKALRSLLGDDAATLTLQMLTGMGAIGLGGFAVIRGLAGLSPASGILSGAHVREAYGSASGAAATVVPGSAVGALPPDGMPGTADSSGGPASPPEDPNPDRGNAAGKENDPPHTSHHPPGIFDKVFGLNPDKTFTERVMNPFFGGDPHNLGWFHAHPGDGQWATLGRCAGTLLTLPIWGVGAVSAAAADHANQMLNEWGEISHDMENMSAYPP
jgi:hypothetical protein